MRKNADRNSPSVFFTTKINVQNLKQQPHDCIALYGLQYAQQQGMSGGGFQHQLNPRSTHPPHNNNGVRQYICPAN